MMIIIHYIKVKIKHHSLVLLIIAVILILFACSTNEGNHSTHDPVAITDIANGVQDTTMERMKEGDDHSLHPIGNAAGNQISDDRMDNRQMNDENNLSDTPANETYWNSLPTNRTVLSAQQAIKPVQGNTNFTLSGNGYITYDWRRNRQVPARIGGRIERLYVKYNYQYVRKGERVIDVYSPEINTYIEEFLYLKSQPNDTILQNKAKQKLVLLGLTPNQIEQITKTGQSPFTISIYSPFEGYVLFNPSGSSEMNNKGNDSAGMNKGMNPGASASPVIASTPLFDNSIREGMYISKDQTLFWINDLKEVWGIVAFTREYEKYVRKGMPVSITSELLSGKPIATSIQFLEQIYQGGQKFSQVRVLLPNPSGLLKQNSLITASLSIPVHSLVVPTSSVYYLGNIAIVWVRVGVTKEGNNIFQAREVYVGLRDGNRVEILQGLKATESIAKDAGYLADSETIINFLDQ